MEDFQKILNNDKILLNSFEHERLSRVQAKSNVLLMGLFFEVVDVTILNIDKIFIKKEYVLKNTYTDSYFRSTVLFKQSFNKEEVYCYYEQDQNLYRLNIK